MPASSTSRGLRVCCKQTRRLPEAGPVVPEREQGVSQRIPEPPRIGLVKDPACRSRTVAATQQSNVRTPNSSGATSDWLPGCMARRHNKQKKQKKNCGAESRAVERPSTCTGREFLATGVRMLHLPMPLLSKGLKGFTVSRSPPTACTTGTAAAAEAMHARDKLSRQIRGIHCPQDSGSGSYSSSLNGGLPSSLLSLPTCAIRHGVQLVEPTRLKA